MKKIFKLFYVITLALILIACGEEVKEFYTIVFYTDGGSTIEPLEVAHGETITLPEAEKEGYSFLGWSLFENSETIIPESTLEITFDLNLYAVWEEIIIEKYTIYFYIDGSQYSSEIYEVGETIFFPDIEMREFFIFDGWYQDKDYLNKIDFTEMKSEDLHIYGRYILNEEIDINTFAVLITEQDDETLKINIIIGGNVNFVGFDSLLNYSENLEIDSVENPLGSIINSTEKGLIYFNYVDATRLITSETIILSITFKKLDFNNFSINLSINKLISTNESYEIFEVPFQVIQIN